MRFEQPKVTPESTSPPLFPIKESFKDALESDYPLRIRESLERLRKRIEEREGRLAHILERTKSLWGKFRPGLSTEYGREMKLLRTDQAQARALEEQLGALKNEPPVQ